MKYSNLQKTMLIFMSVFCCGIVASINFTPLLAPIILGGKSFQARSETVQDLFYFFFTIIFSTIIYLIFLFILSNKKIHIWLNRGNQSLAPRLKAAITQLINSRFLKPIVVIFLIIFITTFLIAQIKIILFPYQLELREGAIQLSTYALTKGINPYSIVNNPIYINVYGILYNALILPFAYLLGNSLLIHRLINAILIFGQLGIIIKVMRMQNVGWIPTIAACLFNWLGQIFHTSSITRPDAFGELLFLISIFIPFIYKFNTVSLIISGIIGILSFQTKAYFVLGSILLCIYLFLFVSKKKALWYFCWIGFLFICSIVILNHFFEMYFVNTLLNNTLKTSRNYAHLVKQCVKFIRDYWGLLIVGIPAFVVNLSQYNFKHLGRGRIVLGDIKKPALEINIDFLYFYLLIFSLLVLIIFGVHSGTFQVYFYQLLTPFFVMVIFRYINKQQMQNLLILFSLITLMTQSFENISPLFKAQNQSDWAKLESEIIHAKNILNSPVDMSLLLKYNKEISISGMTQYFFLFPSYSFILYPDNSDMKKIGDNYISNLYNKIRNKDYDFLETIENANYEPFLIGEKLNPPGSDINFIKQYYHKVKTLELPMPLTNENWVIGIWKPN